VLETSDWSGTPVWIHGDLDSRNLLVRDGLLASVLDFGCLGVGDPACDVMAAWKLVPRELRPRFRAALNVDEATWTRARGWTLAQSLGALVYYTPETNPTLFQEAERWLGEVMGDASR
jgi:aminoglycoside phosphotransferase (APT) family kinase protein